MITGVTVKKLKLVPDERGYLMEMMRCDDPFFNEFGQVYVSATYPGVVKGWHFHSEQSDNIVCVSGMIKLVLYDSRKTSETYGQLQEFFIGENNNTLVHVPKGVYHGWKCVSEKMALVVNCPDRMYDYKKPDEHRLDPHKNDIPYSWERKDG